MLRLIVPGDEYFDDDTQEFVTVGDITLDLEHSLVSVSKWESEYEKPFLSKETKTTEETLDYIKAMILTPEFPPEVFKRLTPGNHNSINNYIQAKQTATWFTELKRAPQSSEVVTSELIYYWMTVFSIPFQPCESWHLNRLLTLIKVCNVKSSKPQKINKDEAAQRMRELNAQRRQKHNTRG